MSEDSRVTFAHEVLSKRIGGNVEHTAIQGLLAYAEERRRVNVGLLQENEQLRKRMGDNIDPLSDAQIRLKAALKESLPCLTGLLEVLEAK